MSDQIISYLRDCCRHVLGVRPGCGFFVAPGILVTCAHVISASLKGSEVRIQRWLAANVEDQKTAIVIDIFPEDDIAILSTVEKDNAFAPLLADAHLNDQLVGIGYPKRGSRQEFDQFTATYEGSTQFLDKSGRAGVEGKFKAAQVEPGFSGGPLLNFRTGRVMGVVVATRDRSTDLGGWAIDISVVAGLLHKLGIDLPAVDPSWPEPAQEQLEGRSRGSQGERNEVGRPIPFQAPALPRHYVERSAVLSKVVEFILDDKKLNGVLLIAAVHGLGGIGKSSLASAVAHSRQVRSRFIDGILWVTLGQEPRPLPLLESWIQAVSDETLATLTVESASSYLRTQLHDRAVLLIVDDAWESDDVVPFLVGGSQCCVLVTARRAEVSDNIGAELFPLQVMTKEESLELICRRIRRPLEQVPADERESAELIVEDVGRHPLALELIGARVARGYTWTETRRQLLVEQKNVDPEAKSRAAVLQRVQASLSLSIRYLREEDVELWESFVWLGLVSPKQKLSMSMLSNFLQCSEARAEFFLNYLADDALLQKAEDGFIIHDLMHEMARLIITRKPPEGLGISIQEGHSIIIENYKRLTDGGGWGSLPIDGYVQNNLAWHMECAGRLDELLGLLSEVDGQGRNAWFTKREEIGQRSGYLGDLRRAQKLIVREKLETPSQHVSLALNLTSIRSITINIRPETICAVVYGGVWSVVKAYQWIRDIHVEEPEFYVQLVIGIDLRADAAGFARVRDQAAELAFEMVIAKESIDPRSILLGKIVGLINKDSQEQYLSRSLAWCGIIHQRIKFVCALPSVLRKQYQKILADDVLVMPQADTKVEYLARLIQGFQPLDAAESSHLFGVMFKEIRRGFSSSSHGVDEAAGSGAGGDPADFRLSDEDSRVEDDQRVRFSFNYVSVGEVSKALHYLPSHLDEIAEQTFKLVKPEDRQMELISKLDDVREHRTGGEKGNSRFWSVIRMVGRTGHFVDAFELLDPSRSFMELMDAISLVDVKYRIDDFLTVFAPAIVRLSDFERSELGKELAKLFPESAVGHALISGSLDPGDAAKIAIYSLRHNYSPERRYIMAQLCVWFGSNQVKAEAFTEQLRIGDFDKQAAAVFALMPYLPNEYPADLLSDFENADIVGSQIAGLTSIVKELVAALSAGSLTEIIEAASHKHSEWWVVEALMMTLLKTKDASAMEAILRASQHVVHLDLRAKLAGCVAKRAADVGNFHLAIQIAKSIELLDLRWQQLTEISVRIAQVGDVKFATAAASAIAMRYERSGAFFSVALELASQGNVLDARKIIESEVNSPEWKDRANQMLSLFDKPILANEKLTGERMTWRRQSDAEETSYALIVKGIAEAEQSFGSLFCFESIKNACIREDDLTLNNAITALWHTDIAGETFSEKLSQCPRPVALDVVRALAPVVAFREDEQEIVRIIKIVRNVGAWWP